MLLSLGLSFLFLLLVHFFPKQMNKYAIILCIPVILAAAICSFTYYHDVTGRVILGVVLIIITIIIIVSLWKNKRSI